MEAIYSEFIQLRNGSVIHWDEDFVRELKGKKYHSVQVTCGACGTKRPVHVTNIRTVVRGMKRTRPGQKFSGLCSTCSRTVFREGADHPNWKGGKWISPGNDYVMRHYQSFPKEFWEILRPMTKGKRKELSEHRGIMAIKLGRPLEADEIVHHMNGTKRDNRPENLRIYKVANNGCHGHHKGHGDYYQEWQDALAEIKRLKSSIISSQILQS